MYHEQTAERLPDLDRRRPAQRLPFLLLPLTDDAPLAARIARRDDLQAEMAARRVVMDAAYAVGDKAAMDEAERAWWSAHYRWLDAVEAVGLAWPRDAAADEMPARFLAHGGAAS